MAESREEILANFQACTGIEDIGEAISVLDENYWNLEAAVNHTMEQNAHKNSGDTNPRISEVIEIADSPVETSTETLSSLVEDHQPSTSTLNHEPASRTLLFNVQYSDRVVPVYVKESETLADIKMKIYKEFKVPPCKQLLSGWARIAEYENTPLSKLMLPYRNALMLTTKSIDGMEESKTSERLGACYQLKITDLSTSKTYNLSYPGAKAVLDVKTDVSALTHIALRHQRWTGWPPNLEDHSLLAMAGLGQPEHELTVEAEPNDPASSASSAPTSGAVGLVVGMESDDEEFEDASENFGMDDYFVDNVASKKVEPLKSIEDDIVGSIQFSEQFTQRYGPTHPTFFVGTLDDALKEACNKPTKYRKILGLYLHHDNSVLSNVFCTQLLGSESIIQMIENNFVFWGWDVTYQSNKARLYRAISQSLGHKVTTSLWNIPSSKLPAIIVIMKNRSNIIVYTVIYGNVGVNELLSRLVEVVEVFSDNQRTEIQEEQERAERELVKWEQDMAYNESLEADRAKEELKRQQAEAEQNEKKRLEYEKEVEWARKEAHRKEVEASLPPEPGQEQGDITKIRFRLPLGDHLERRFFVSTPLKVLLDYLVVQGYPTDEYKAISSWPRRDLTVLDVTKTLEELKLCPQETVILEQR